jgi:hypothetical protein
MVQTLLLQCDCGPNISVALAMSQAPLIKKSGYWCLMKLVVPKNKIKSFVN